ncbi:MAG: glycerophosphodiester phosphodiesterase family protein [Rothia sp. (in: high G+C Gram-positive bacteria)]|nr:glycerophosphodiester phosphodiesterase family protein [Rothia sp. (in: high G+C Gram-positive bacteria)]
MPTISQTPRPLHYFEPFAHRGYAQDVPENTLAAFAAAQKFGVEWMEIDVNTTADGVVIVFHDFTLNRVAGVPGKVAEKTWQEIQQITLKGGHKIPSLAQVLQEFPQLKFNIDVKDEGSMRELPAVVAQAGAVDRVRIASFSERRRAGAVRALRKLLTGQKVKTSASEMAIVGFYVIAHTVPSLWPVARAVGKIFIEPFDSLQIPPTYKVLGREVKVATPALIDMAHRYGYTVQLWTIDCPKEMKFFMERGVDGIVTNRTDVLMKILSEKK